MRRFALPLAAAAVVAIAGACTPGANPAAGASPSPGASRAPSAGATRAPSPGASTITIVTPAPTKAPRAAAPVTIVKATIDGKPATVEPLAYYTMVPGTGNASIFWNVGTLAKSGEANIGQGLGLLKEGEGNFTIHMKMPLTADQELDLRTLTEPEYKGAANLTYKEGPRALTWYSNGQTATSGTFKVEGDVITFAMVADMPADQRGNGGLAHKIEFEVKGLPRPESK